MLSNAINGKSFIFHTAFKFRESSYNVLLWLLFNCPDFLLSLEFLEGTSKYTVFFSAFLGSKPKINTDSKGLSKQSTGNTILAEVSSQQN